MKVITGNRVPIKMWAEQIESSAMAQAVELASLPFAFHHVALMPDCHTGQGMPIGGVLATDGCIIPNAVGVDIGCGMCAVKTNLRAEQLSHKILSKIVDDIKRVIPLGFDHQLEVQDERLMPQGHNIDALPKIRTLYHSALRQLGTLGGGNHFIEIQHEVEMGSREGFAPQAEADTAQAESTPQDKMGGQARVWIMLHSGSRNLGLKVAGTYNKRAQLLNKAWRAQTFPQLSFFPMISDDAKLYFMEMKYCVDFALANRKLMMHRICEVMQTHLPGAVFEPMINIAHNYAAWEHHFGKDVIVHRKGATRAREGEIGIIPGSQGTPSYIVEGLGNPDSFMSCSHGAGRVLGRKEAIRSLNLQQEQLFLNQQGIIHSVLEAQNLDEAPSAYKNIEQVMAHQADLVRPLVKLQPMAVIKG